MNRNQIMLQQMFALSRNRPGHQSLFAFATKESARDTMVFARDMLLDGESLCMRTGRVSFPNGSRIVVDFPECVRGDRFHLVIIDEIADERMVAHLKTRERL